VTIAEPGEGERNEQRPGEQTVAEFAPATQLERAVLR